MKEGSSPALDSQSCEANVANRFRTVNTPEQKESLALEQKEKEGAKPQRDRFIETARSLGADEEEAAFKAKLAVIARRKPKAHLPKPPKESE